MKQLIDFIPLVVFFVAYKMQGIYIATGALIATTALQTIITYLLVKKVAKMQLITFAMVAIFGGMTLFFHDDNFIKWKVTIVYTLLAIGLAVSHALGRSAIKDMLTSQLSLPDAIWSKINIAWIAFFLVCAGLNIAIAFSLPLDIWVKFKLFGLLIITLLFTLITGFYIYQHVRQAEQCQQDSDKNEPDHTS